MSYDKEYDPFAEIPEAVDRVLKRILHFFGERRLDYFFGVPLHFLQLDIDCRKLHIFVHCRKVGLVEIELALYFRKPGLHEDHIIDRLRLVHHDQKPLLFFFQGLLVGLLVRINLTYILCTY